MPVEWALLGSWVSKASSARGLLMRASGADMVRTLNAIGDNNARTAARLLREAEARDGTARREKLRTALGHLESSYQAYSDIAQSAWRGVWEDMMPGRYKKAAQNAAQVALLLAGTYKALGHDPKSVTGMIDNARQMFASYEKAYWREFGQSWSAGAYGFQGVPLSAATEILDKERALLEEAIKGLTSLPRGGT